MTHSRSDPRAPSSSRLPGRFADYAHLENSAQAPHRSISLCICAALGQPQQLLETCRGKIATTTTVAVASNATAYAATTSILLVAQQLSQSSEPLRPSAGLRASSAQYLAPRPKQNRRYARSCMVLPNSSSKMHVFLSDI